MLIINGLKSPGLQAVQSLIKSTSAKPLNVLVNIFSQKNTPCKHFLYIYIFILNVPENSNLLQQMFLTRAELNKLFNSNINEEQQSPRLTLKALLETTSTLKNNVTVCPQMHVKLTSSLLQKPVLPEP